MKHNLARSYFQFWPSSPNIIMCCLSAISHLTKWPHLLFSGSSFLTRLHNFLNDVLADAERAEIQFRWKSDNHYHYLIILSEDSSPGGLSLHLRQSRAHHRSQPWQDVHCPSVVHFPKQLNKLFIGWIMATCSTVYGVSQKSVLIEQNHKVDRCLARNSPRPTTFNRPTYWAPNEPARPICAQESIFLGH